MRTMKRRITITLITVSLLLGVALMSRWRGTQDQVSLAAPQTSDGHPAAASKSDSVSHLPLPAQAAISATLGRDNAAYHAVARGRGFHAANPKHGLAAEFTPDGLEVGAGAARWQLRLEGYGYGESLAAVTAANPQANANRVEYRRGDLTEWYVNGPVGLEQGFTLDKAPGESRGEPLTMAMAMGGDLRARLEPEGVGLTLTYGGGQTARRYGGVSAWDASGRELRAWLELREEQVWLRVDDAGAQYPVVVDPFVRQAKLTASDGAATDHFGNAIAISGDTVVVGAYGDDIGVNFNQGSAYIFVKPGGGWAGALNESARLTASDGAADDRFGNAIAISSDTVVVGADSDTIGANSSQGATYVFAKPMGGWAGALGESAKLTSSDGAAFYRFGRSVAIYADTVVIVAPF